MKYKVTFILGRVKKQVTYEEVKDRIFLSFAYNKRLLQVIKTDFTKARWHPDVKKWSILNCEHNWFQIAYYCGINPYKEYDEPLGPLDSLREQLTPYAHQEEMARHIIYRKRAIIAGEMGVGKTLAAIIAIELANIRPCWWVGPKSAITSVQLEFKKWGCKYNPQFITYASLTRFLNDYEGPAPKGVFYDESQYIKNSKSQRSKAAAHLAKAVREEHDGYVVAMTGTPSPNKPDDWYNQCETVCPGYIKEGDDYKFKHRLAKVEQVTMDGNTFPKLVTWWDNTEKCAECGYIHEGDEDHRFVKSLRHAILVRPIFYHFHFHKVLLNLPFYFFETLRLLFHQSHCP